MVGGLQKSEKSEKSEKSVPNPVFSPNEPFLKGNRAKTLFFPYPRAKNVILPSEMASPSRKTRKTLFSPVSTTLKTHFFNLFESMKKAKLRSTVIIFRLKNDEKREISCFST